MKLKAKALPLEGEYVKTLVKRCATAFQSVRVFRRNIVAIPREYKGKRHYIKAGEAGQADCYAIGDGGKHFEIEVKRFTELNPDQRIWREWCVNRGIPWALLDVVPGEMPAQTVERWVVELRRFFGV